MNSEEPDNSKKAPSGKGLLGRFVAACSILYLIVIVCLWVILWSAADDWWLATVLLFGAQWVWILPFFILLPLAFFCSRRSLPWLFLSGIIFLFPIMSFNVPLQSLWAKTQNGQHLRVMTCNTHMYELNPQALRDLIASTKSDIVALQEFDFGKLKEIFPKKDWQILSDDELCIASRYPIKKVKDLIEPDHTAGGGRATCYSIDLSEQPLYLINMHLASPHPGFDAVASISPTADHAVEKNITARREQARIVSDFAMRCGHPVILTGDFNTPVNSRIYRQYWENFQNAFSIAGWGLGHTYFFAERSQVRIDHILLSSDFNVNNCKVFPSVGSKHLPVMADLDFSPKTSK